MCVNERETDVKLQEVKGLKRFKTEVRWDMMRQMQRSDVETEGAAGRKSGDVSGAEAQGTKTDGEQICYKSK